MILLHSKFFNALPRLTHFRFLSAICLVSLWLMACDDEVNNFDLEKDPLRGKMGGEEWQYASGRAEFSPLFVNTVDGLILPDNTSDPCGIRISSKAHLQVRFPAVRGNYNISTFIRDEGYVIFTLPQGSKRLTATSGFIDVVDVSGNDLIGFMSANFDDDNEVQGTFYVEICN